MMSLVYTAADDIMPSAARSEALADIDVATSSEDD
jgi:hypothetical protein